MREVEVKYHVRDVEALLVAMKARGLTLSAPVRQDDQAYAPEWCSYGDSKLGVPFVRLRTVDGRHTFTLKRPAENALSCDEHETLVADREQMHHVILAMGFTPTVRVVKVRRTAELPDLSLCVDEVAGLGTFMELERMVADGHRAADRDLAELPGPHPGGMRRAGGQVAVLVEEGRGRHPAGGEAGRPGADRPGAQGA